jgi:protein-disulfide isomerase
MTGRGVSVLTRLSGGAPALVLAVLAVAPVPAAGQPGPPPRPVVIDTEGAPSLGPDTAPVTIVEFADFKCPFCARGATALRKLLAIYPDRVRWVFKHFPLQTAHAGAALAHEAAIAAQEQGKFWEMHELIFSDPTRIRYSDLVSHAEQLGLDMILFKEALDTRRLRARVVRDLDEGRRLQVTATPTYFVNGVRHMGARSTPEFRFLVDSSLRRPAREPSGAGITVAPGGAPPPGNTPPPAAGSLIGR